MIKVTFGELARIRAPIDNTGSTLLHLRQIGKETPFADRIKISRLADELAGAIGEYEKALSALVDECGGVRVKNDPSVKKVPDDRIDEFTTKLTDLDKIEIEVNALPLRAATFSSTGLTTYDLTTLAKFITFDDL